MTFVIKHCRDKKNKKKIDRFRKKLMILKSEISECSEYNVKSKKGNVFVKEKILQ